MTLYDVDRRLVRGRREVGTDTVTVEANSPEHAGEVAAHEPHGLEGNIAVSCRNVRVAPPPKAWVDEYAPVGPSGAIEGDDVAVRYEPGTTFTFKATAQNDGPVTFDYNGQGVRELQPPKRRPGRPRKAA